MVRTPHRRRGSAAAVVVVILALALIAGGLWYFVFRSTPERTVTTLLEAARAGDEDAMRDCLTERSATGHEMVTALTRQLAGRDSAEPTWSIGESVVSEDRATVPVEFDVGGAASLIAGDSITIPYVLHREGRIWLVDAPETQAEALRQAAGGLLEFFRQFILPGAPGGTFPPGRT